MLRVLIPASVLLVAAACSTGDFGGPGDTTDGSTTPNNSPADCVGAACGGPNSCQDADGDGYGAGCAGGPDCDDSDPLRSPGRQEVCDGRDNDCNGSTDELPSCTATQCVDADGDGQGVMCAAGLDCDDTDPERFDGAPEACDAKDNDCDGQADEDFSLGEMCTVGQGDCTAEGTTVCGQDGTGTTCNASPGAPSTEVCDRADNDCDGQVDEGLNCPACIEDGNEPNDRNVEGTPLSSGSATGHLCAGNADWFRLGSHSAGDTVSVSVSFSSGDGNVDMEMYIGGIYATGSYGNGDTESITHTLASSGNVDVIVYFKPNTSPGESGAAFTVSR